MSILLFDQKRRTLQGPASYNTDLYSYYNESARPEIGNVRNRFESWFAKYPEDEKDDLKMRLKVAFFPTLFELFVYILFTELGYTLEVHPAIHGTTKHPDYAARKGEEIIYLEAKFMTLLSVDEQSLERRKNALLDSIDKIDASNFLLSLQTITFKDSSQPSGKKVINFFNREIAAFNPDDYREQAENNGLQGLPQIIYEDDKIKIEVNLWPKSAIHRGIKSRSIANTPSIFQIGNDSDGIKSSLKAKAMRYGNLNAPYIICVNKQGVGLDIFELQEALYGSIESSWSDNPNNRDEKIGFAGNGFFGSQQSPKFTRVSAVYFTNAGDANLGTTAKHFLRHNLQAKFPVDLKINQSIKELLGIEDDYPFQGLPDKPSSLEDIINLDKLTSDLEIEINKL